MKKTWLCIALCLSLLASAPVVATELVWETRAGGWNETAWVEISGVSDSDVTAVSYAGPVTGSLIGQDLEFLVRNTDTGVRIDIPGLPAGAYTVKVQCSRGLVDEQVTVQAQDRSGYAHFGDTQGVGAYDNAGKLKENAIVLYVTEENKNTVTVTSKDGTTVSGIGNILNSRGRRSNAGSKVNTNQDILHKLADDGTPLVVRIIGRVTLPEGLTAFNSTDYGGSKGDNGAMARMEGGKDITIEGIGEGATIDGWGLHFICGGGDYARGWGRSFEVRNLSFYNVPEDCVGMEGETNQGALTAPVERCWIHHCAFYAPKIANPAESDKDGGDGACDFKRGQYFTNAYCYYYGYHKTNLVGGSDSDPQYHMTYHHNYWKNCESRGPLARQANIHMYNNIFENQSSYCMNPRANAYIFSEYNLFLNSKDPVTVKAGAVKSYGDVFENCRGDNHATIVADKGTPVDTKCKYANFDTNALVSYIPNGEYVLQESIEDMKTVVLAASGPQGMDHEDPLPDVPDSGDITAPAGSYAHDFTESGTASEFFEINGNLSKSKGSVSYAGKTLTQCLKMESSTSIRFGAPEKGTLLLVFGGSTDAAGKTVKLNATKYAVGPDGTLTVAVQAGWHTITKGDSINLFYMVYVSESAPQEHIHEYAETVTKVATCLEAGEALYACACGDSYSKALAKTAHSYETEVKQPTCTEGGGVVHTCTVCAKSYTDAPTAALGHSYVENVVAPTCTQDGYSVFTCEACGDSYEGELMAATGHRYDLEETAEATVYTCMDCGHSYRNEKIPCSHEYGPWVTVKEPTDDEEGIQTQTCMLCGAQETQKIPALTHLRDLGGWVWAAVAAGGVTVLAVAILLLKKKKVA